MGENMFMWQEKVTPVQNKLLSLGDGSFARIFKKIKMIEYPNRLLEFS